MGQSFEKSKNAYLVLAHEDAAMLNILIKRLLNTGVVYIHIDKDCEINSSEIVQSANVKIFRKFRVKWGGWSIVQATMLLADMAIVDGATRLTLLSGVSYPVVSDQVLFDHAFSDLDIFAAGPVDLKAIDKTFYRRFTSRHLEFKMGNSVFARSVRRLSRELFQFLPRLKPESNLLPLNLTLGSQWWSVTADTYKKGLALSTPQIESYFRKIECSDESFFGTLFTPVTKSHRNIGTTFVIWGKNGRPVYLNEFDSLSFEKYMFARKFRSKGFDVVKSKI